MKIVETRQKVHLSTRRFLDYAYMIFHQGRFLTEEVNVISAILTGDALYEARVRGTMVPNNTIAQINISREQLTGVASAMSYFCDKYGVLKGFILGELYFRKGETVDGIRNYARVLVNLGGRLALKRAEFYLWFADDLSKKI